MVEITNVSDLRDALKSVNREASENSRHYGTGWVRWMQLDGNRVEISSIHPSRVLYMPDDPEIPE